MDAIAQVEVVDHGGEVVGVVVHVVAVEHLLGAPVPAAVVRDHAIALVQKEHHLRVPVVQRQRPAVAEDHRLSRSPVLVVDLYAVVGCDRAHGREPLIVRRRVNNPKVTAARSWRVGAPQKGQQPRRCLGGAAGCAGDPAATSMIASSVLTGIKRGSAAGAPRPADRPLPRAADEVPSLRRSPFAVARTRGLLVLDQSLVKESSACSASSRSAWRIAWLVLQVPAAVLARFGAPAVSSSRRSFFLVSEGCSEMGNRPPISRAPNLPRQDS